MALLEGLKKKFLEKILETSSGRPNCYVFGNIGIKVFENVGEWRSFPVDIFLSYPNFGNFGNLCASISHLRDTWSGSVFHIAC